MASKCEVVSIGESGEHIEGRRASITTAFKLARMRFRDYRGQKQIEVRRDGVLLGSSDACDLTLSFPRREFPKSRGR